MLSFASLSELISEHGQYGEIRSVTLRRNRSSASINYVRATDAAIARKHRASNSFYGKLEASEDFRMDIDQPTSPVFSGESRKEPSSAEKQRKVEEADSKLVETEAKALPSQYQIPEKPSTAIHSKSGNRPSMSALFTLKTRTCHLQLNHLCGSVLPITSISWPGSVVFSNRLKMTPNTIKQISDKINGLVMERSQSSSYTASICFGIESLSSQTSDLGPAITRLESFHNYFQARNSAGVAQFTASSGTSTSVVQVLLLPGSLDIAKELVSRIVGQKGGKWQSVVEDKRKSWFLVVVTLS